LQQVLQQWLRSVRLPQSLLQQLQQLPEELLQQLPEELLPHLLARPPVLLQSLQ